MGVHHPAATTAAITEDVEVACRDCGEAFVSMAAERAALRARGFAPLVRCPACRVRRRDERNALALAGYAEATPINPSGPARAPSEGNVRPGFTAVCAACGRDTALPFRPRHDRPVYCRSCLDRRSGR